MSVKTSVNMPFRRSLWLRSGPLSSLSDGRAEAQAGGGAAAPRWPLAGPLRPEPARRGQNRRGLLLLFHAYI